MARRELAMGVEAFGVCETRESSLSIARLRDAWKGGSTNDNAFAMRVSFY